MQKAHVNVKALIREAQASQHREAFRVLVRDVRMRLGVGARIDDTGSPAFFVEAMLFLYPLGREDNLAAVETVLGVLKTLKSMGFTITHQDDSCISYEKRLERNELQKEVQGLSGLFREHSNDRS
jgi:hypothetical protein